MHNHLTIYLKPTEACNLECLHCYNKIGDQLSILDFQKLDKFMQSIADYYSNSVKDTVLEVVFHGGEPFLVGADRLKEIVTLVRARLPFTNNIFSAQTNLTLLGDKELDFIEKDLNGLIGTSYSPGLRFTGGDQSKYSLWRDNLLRLKERSLRYYFVITLCKEYVEAFSTDHLLQFLGETRPYGFHFEPLTRNGLSETYWDQIAISPNTYDSWKVEFAKKFIDSEAYYSIPESTIVTKAKTFFDRQFVGCACRDCMLKTITINADGTIGLCPNTSKKEIVGTLDTPFSEILKSTIRLNQIIKERMRRQECMDCEFFQVCNGGCMQVEECFEGKEFFRLLQTELKANPKFLEHVQNYDRASILY